jgi:TolB protein
MKKLLAVILLLACGAVALADDVTIVKSGRFTMSQPTFTGNDAQLAATMNSVVAFDMRASGYFALGNTGTEILIVSGTFQRTGDAVTVDVEVKRRDRNQQIFTRRYTGNVSKLRALCHQISDDAVEAIGKYSSQPMIGIAQTRIAFIYKRGGTSELAVMDYDGHNVTVLTKDASISARPRWVNEHQIVYMSYRSGAPAIYLVDLRTNQRTRLTSFPGLNTSASPSPDGTRVAVVLGKDGNPELYTMTIGGGGLQRLTRTRGAESSPTWSPDGARIAYVSDEGGTPQVYVMSVPPSGSGAAQRLTRHATYCTEPDWSPLGDRLVVVSRAAGAFSLFLVDVASGGATQLQTGGDAMDATWSPNGKILAFTRLSNHRASVALFDADAQELIALPALDGECAEPAWGPRSGRR